MKKLRPISSILVGIMICITACLCGILTGQIINSKYFNTLSYLDIDPNTLRDDISTLNYQNKTPADLSGVNNFLAAYNTLSLQPYYKISKYGEIDTSIGVKQTADMLSEKNGDIYHQEYVSCSSLIKTAGSYSFRLGDNIVITKGNAKGSKLNQVEWTNKTETYSFSDYSNKIGRLPTDETIYIVSTKTILQETVLKTENEQFLIELKLNPKLSTICYLNEIAFQTGTNKNELNFLELKINLILDSDFRLISQEIFEIYEMKYAGIKVTVNAKYNITFTY